MGLPPSIALQSWPFPFEGWKTGSLPSQIRANWAWYASMGIREMVLPDSGLH